MAISARYLTRTGLTRRCVGFYSVPTQTFASNRLASPFNQPEGVHYEFAYRPRAQELLVLQDKMTDEITLCWHPNRSAEVLTSVDAVVDRLLKITFGTTPNSGVAAVLAKPNGQQMVVIVAGHYWCLDWFPEDYNDQGCVGSYHTVSAENEISSNDFVTYCLQGHHGECLLSQTIRKEDAIQAIRSFLASSQRPDCVQWEMD